MRVYQLLWFLLRHGLKGRFRDEVFLSVDFEDERRTLGLTGAITDISVESSGEAFLIINAVCEDDGPHVEDPPFIDHLIEASSLGTPEALALRDSVPDEVVERIIARAKQIDATSRHRPC